MIGIDLDREVQFLHASLRFFRPKEHHINRFCTDDVLLLVFDGALRFEEDGVAFEIKPGQYHIQRHNTLQSGPLASSSPKYLYVHFRAKWGQGATVLPRSGNFNVLALKPLMHALDSAAHSATPYTVKAGIFFNVLQALFETVPENNTANQIAVFLQKSYASPISLELLCEKFHFCKNHIINLFKKEFDQTPTAYLNQIRLEKAAHFIESTSEPTTKIARNCGFRQYSHFYRQFVNKYKISPEKFRAKTRMGLQKQLK